MSMLVAVLTAISLAALSVDLWLVFGVWPSGSVPPTSMRCSLLRCPYSLILDPAFSTLGVLLALLLPLSAHSLAGNVLEPLLFGHTLQLHPVTVLLSLLLWGSVWGITGMVLAIPITAVARIS